MKNENSGWLPASRPVPWLAAGVLVLIPSLLLPWWKTPSLPDTFPEKLENLDRQAWHAGVQQCFPDQYAAFHQRFLKLRHRWREESSKWWSSWSREEFDRSYQDLVSTGLTLVSSTKIHQGQLHGYLKSLLETERIQLARLRALTGGFDLRGNRMALSLADGLLAQGFLHLGQGRYEQVTRLLMQTRERLQPVESKMIQQMERYGNPTELKKWNQWVSDTIESSDLTGQTAIVVIKASREFRVYQKGILRYRFPIELGFSGLQDKLYEGDGATPEGIFRIRQKKGSGETKFHKALLLDYPTPTHQRRFREAKTRGMIPAQRQIGGLIEIHGQSTVANDSTNGCIALENRIMDRVFNLVSMGTTVVVVGTLDAKNPVSHALASIKTHQTSRLPLAFQGPPATSPL